MKQYVFNLGCTKYNILKNKPNITGACGTYTISVIKDDTIKKWRIQSIHLSDL